MPGSQPPHWCRTGLVVAAGFLMMACASAARPAPRASAPAERAGYPGRCALLAVEHSTRESDMPSDSVELVARYRPEAGATPFGLAFQVRRERADDLRAHLEQHPAVLCGPEPEVDPDAVPVYSVEVPPFEGQQGTYVGGGTD
ncbi:MAG: hypothetical protein OXT09_30690 [Myxococcales bacterium]|nr:hypothetical protein [Myxococcales bacterium]